MNDIEKYDFIEKQYGNSNFIDLSKVIQLLDDNDECIRIEMIEACYACEQKEIHKKLFDKLETAEGLEKGYLLLTLSYIYEDDKEIITPYLKKGIFSEDQIEKLDSYIGLIIVGNDSYLKDVLLFFDLPDYHLRCASVNMLSELIQNDYIDYSNLNIIKEKLTRLENVEKTKAVHSSINNLVNVINDKLQEKSI